ncbi:MAG TPA: hypothetical protein VK701_07585 [Solirubrobacteraceae bacterium]|jgi:hypothetical protein|nr:hypothetical protein [Solirubrobacteraceae bacterium]
MHVFLSRSFRFGTPVLAVLVGFGYAPWWAILVPVLPVWWSFLAGVREVHRAAGIIRRPRRGVSLEEHEAEQRFWRADARLVEADALLNEAVADLAAARRVGAREGRSRFRRVLGKFGDPRDF